MIVGVCTSIWANGDAKSRLVFLGDSLTAGYQIRLEQAFPNLIQERVGPTMTIVNAGVSGDTSFGALNRLDWLIQHQDPDIVFVCIGANDGLRGLPIPSIKTNIEQIVGQLKQQGVDVILAGVSLPENYTPDYIDAFESMYEEVADQYGIPLFPSLVEGVGGVPSLNLQDRVHPNEAGHRVMADHIYEFLVSHNRIVEE